MSDEDETLQLEILYDYVNKAHYACVTKTLNSYPYRRDLIIKRFEPGMNWSWDFNLEGTNEDPD